MTHAGRSRASLIRRGVAYVIDCACAFLVFVAIQVSLAPLREAWLGTRWQTSGAWLELYVLLTISLPVWLVFALGDASPRGATPGKRLLGLAVRTRSGGRLAYRRALLRTIVKLLPWEVAHAVLNLPANPLIDPQTGDFRAAPPDMPFDPWWLLSPALLGLWVLIVTLDPLGRGPHDRAAGSIVTTATDTLVGASG